MTSPDHFGPALRIIELEGLLGEALRAITRHYNFLEALGITLLDEEDVDEACHMVREALGRPSEREPDENEPVLSEEDEGTEEDVSAEPGTEYVDQDPDDT